MDPKQSVPLVFLPGDPVSWVDDDTERSVRTGQIVAVGTDDAGEGRASIKLDMPPGRGWTKTLPTSALSLVPSSRDQLRAGAFMALTLIHERLAEARRGGDEWAAEFLTEEWPALVPSDVREHLGLTPDEQD